jgi:predicted Fe-S protein YdhL (DUF1289 family)
VAQAARLRYLLWTLTESPSRTPMPIESPCIKVCQLEEASGWCIGCGRTLAEIGGWSAMSPPDRRAVMDTLPARLAMLGQGQSPRCAPRRSAR